MASFERCIWALEIDYDGTAALTSEIPPGGMDVNGAYAASITDQLGEDSAQAFLDRGGHNHQTPLEIAHYLKPAMGQDELVKLAKAITGGKLDILCDQIGMPLPDGGRWPRPTEGFRELWTEVSESKHGIGTAVISAGHTDFERTWFDRFNLPQPDCMVTEEVVSGLAINNVPIEMLAKPSPLLAGLARVALESKYSADLGRVVYAGDDPHKDQSFAANTGADFVLIEKDHARTGWTSVGRLLGLELEVVDGASNR